METDPNLEFDFYLAEKLGRFVHEIRDMPADEHLHWTIYYARKAQKQQIANAQKGGRRG